MAVKAFNLFSNVDLSPTLPQIKAPTLLIVGSKCTPRRKTHMKEMCDLLPSAKLVELQGFDYGIHFLAPDSVVAEVLSFLREYT